MELPKELWEKFLQPNVEQIRLALKNFSYEELLKVQEELCVLVEDYEEKRKLERMEWAKSFETKYYGKYKCDSYYNDSKVNLKISAREHSLVLYWDWHHGHYTQYVLVLPINRNKNDIIIHEISDDGYDYTQRVTEDNFPFEICDEMLEVFALYLIENPTVDFEPKWFTEK